LAGIVTDEAPRARGVDPWAALVAIAAGAAAAIALRFARGFPWSLALVAGLAVGVFTQVLVRTVRNLRAVWFPRGARWERDDREPPAG
jgi:hypothetical protein